MKLIENLTIFALIATANLVVSALWAFYMRNSRTLPYFIYGVLSFIVILGIHLMIKTIEIWL